jgi:hypothetical protein
VNGLRVFNAFGTWIVMPFSVGSPRPLWMPEVLAVP